VLEAASKRRRSGRRSQCHDVCLLVCELDHDRSLGPNPTCPAPLDATSPFLFFVTFTILWAEFHLRRLIQHSFFHSFHHSDPDLCRLVTSNAHTTTRSPPSHRSPSRSRLANTTPHRNSSSSILRRSLLFSNTSTRRFVLFHPWFTAYLVHFGFDSARLHMSIT
jgi:hypothetical protein